MVENTEKIHTLKLRRISPTDFIEAARVPGTVKPAQFGLWEIRRVSYSSMKDELSRLMFLDRIGSVMQTSLFRWTEATMHLNPPGKCVMEDSIGELRKHLPIWMNGCGRILVTGLGLGCVVRGLLINPMVEHIVVVEIDRRIIDAIAPEFKNDPRVEIIHSDAFKVDLGKRRFDFAWHDLWTEDGSLPILHMRLMEKFRLMADFQGAWNFPRSYKRLMPSWYFG